jgi:hypothetical protein
MSQTADHIIAERRSRKSAWLVIFAIIGGLWLLGHVGGNLDQPTPSTQTQNSSGLPAREEEKLEKLAFDVSAKMVAGTVIYEQYCGPVSNKAKQFATNGMRFTSEERVRREILAINRAREEAGNALWCSTLKPGMESD